jgi:hypothetical protein
MTVFESQDATLKCLFDAWWFALTLENFPAIARLDELISKRLDELT